jgi:DNA modification methylase
MERLQIIQGDCRMALKQIPDKSVQCCVTSPPFFGLRDYHCFGQIGLEPSPAEYIAALKEVFREVWRVLRDDGTLWLNLGDSYANDGKWGGHTGGKHVKALHNSPIGRNKRYTGLKPKDLCGIPWRVAFALQDAGWHLRQDIIWHKPNPMPESVTDRCTKSHEYIFLLTKSAKYFYDQDAIREPISKSMFDQIKQGYNGNGQKDYESNGVQNPSSVKARIIANARASWNGSRFDDGKNLKVHPNVGKRRSDDLENYGMSAESNGELYGPRCTHPAGANKRSVWTIPASPYAAAHFATFPPALVRPCIMAGSRAGDLVLDPFFGSGTTGQVALELGRRCVGIDLNPEYCKLAQERTNVTPGLAL